MRSLPDIQGAEFVVAAFGNWPSFHDAEVLRLVLERDSTQPGKAPGLRLSVRVRRYEQQGIGTADYQLALTHDFTIEFTFSDISELDISGFNGQNVIDDMVIHRPDGGSTIAVEIEPIFGLGASWQCKDAAVSDIRPSQGAA